MLSANLKADDRDFEYLMIILNAKIDPSKKLLDFECKSGVEEESSFAEVISHTKMDYYNKMDSLMMKTKAEMNFSFTTIPNNFLELYKHYFYSTCSLCKQPGTLTICLLCGDMICRRSCNNKQRVSEEESR